MLHESETNENNGVEVKLAVKQDDLSEFVHKASQVFKTFDPIPTITGHSININSLKTRYSGKGWKLVESQNTYDHRARAVQGNVVYPIDFNKIITNDKITLVKENEFYIDFQIGELDVAASREALSYDDSTVKVLTARLESVYDDFMKQLQAAIGRCKSEWEARVALKTLVEKMYNASHIKIDYDGKMINNDSISIKSQDISTQVFRYTSSYRRNSEYERTHLTKHNTFSVEPVENAYFVVRNPEESRKAITRAKHLAVSKQATVYLIDTMDKVLIEKLGNPQVIDSATIELPPTEKAARASAAANKKVFMPYQGSFSSYNAVSLSDIDSKGVKFYVNTKRQHVLKSENEIFQHSFSSLISNAMKLGIISKDAPIYAAPIWATRSKKFVKAGWMNLLSYVEKKTKEMVASEADQIALHMNLRASRREIQLSAMAEKIMSMKNLENRLAVDSKVLTIRDSYDNLRQAIDEKIAILINTATMFSIRLPEGKVQKIESLDEAYPMISLVHRYSIDSDATIKMVFDYINMVDASRRTK
jgi:hypothetical protein